MYRASEPILECFLLDCGCEYKGVGSYDSIKKKAVGMWTHTHITRLDHLEKLGAWHKLGVCVFKCCFAGPKGTEGGEY